MMQLQKENKLTTKKSAENLENIMKNQFDTITILSDGQQQELWKLWKETEPYLWKIRRSNEIETLTLDSDNQLEENFIKSITFM